MCNEKKWHLLADFLLEFTLKHWILKAVCLKLKKTFTTINIVGEVLRILHLRWGF